MRCRWLAVWYLLLILMLIELMLFGLSGIVSDHYRTMLRQSFNAGVRELHDVDAQTPYAEYINAFARRSGISPVIVAAVIRAESSFQPRALSKSGAYGLMQVIPGTWRQVNKDLMVCSGRHSGECTVECYYDPELNIQIGAAYLGQLNQQFNGDMVLALAAYNAGPGAVSRYGGLPPYRETTDYVNRVIGYWEQATGRAGPDSGGDDRPWSKAHQVIGWLLILTVGLGLLISRHLYRSAGSWRWR